MIGSLKIAVSLQIWFWVRYGAVEDYRQDEGETNKLVSNHAQFLPTDIQTHSPDPLH